MTKKRPENGGEPTVIAKCTECGDIYPAQEATDGNYRPIGTNGSCNCGNRDFEPAT
ncbi:hypothetical protein SAMN05421858_2271 [Haladaptatus litoreus]|uniref:Uncharacterized protein n=1 Tax=Haladaptatus litoreus TaxID=553468 RepID=A0A1N7A174_9EURY|nr:hypothetical protein SAMN05421858_2271 [Haladaptatus litoreus]